QSRLVALAARQFAIQLQEQRTGVGKTRQVIGDREILRLLILERVLHGERHLGTYRQQNAQVVGCKKVLFGMVEGDHSNHTLQALQRNRQGRSQGAVLGRIV